MSAHRKKTLYFAYGLNMDPQQIKERLVEDYPRNFAILRGYRLAFNKIAKGEPGVGYANIVRDDYGIVEAVLYEIDKEKLKILDRHEGVPEHYKRCEITVECKDSKYNICIYKALAYIANENMVDKGEKLKPTKEYIEHLLKAKDLLSKEYVETLQKKTSMKTEKVSQCGSS